MTVLRVVSSAVERQADERRSLRDMLAGTVVIVNAPKDIVVPDRGPVKSTSMFR